MTDDQEQILSEWVGHRREADAGAGFSRAVMAQIRAEESSNDRARAVVPAWVPRPVLTSFCLVAGIAKVLLVVQVAF